MKHVQKKKPEEIRQRPPAGLLMSQRDWETFERGVRLFNDRKFWHSHEAWEEVWNAHSADGRLFLQGLIQLAAAYHHLIEKRSLRGLMNNFEKAYGKLEVFLPEYLGVHVKPLLVLIEKGREEAMSLDEGAAEDFDLRLIPRIQFRKPSDPDCAVEVKDMVDSARFQDGARLFNSGYYWEAHEAWEDIWRLQETNAKIFAQAFVQMAAAYSFIKLGKLSSAKYLFEKSIEKFEQFEHEECIVRTRPLLDAMKMSLAAVEYSLSNRESPIRIPAVPLIALAEKRTNDSVR